MKPKTRKVQNERGEEVMNPLDEWDDEGMTPLMIAVFRGDQE